MTQANHTKEEFQAYDLFIFLTTILALLVVLVFTFPGSSPGERSIALALDFLISLVFLGDFLRSLVKAPDRREYMRWGWLDLLGSLPAHPALRLLRVARLIGIYRLMSRVGMREMLRVYRKQRAESVFWTTLFISMLVFALSSLVILAFENGADGAEIKTGADALWWTIVTVTTVGYGDLVPITNAGRGFAALLMLVGVGLVSVLTSYITTSLLIYKAGDDTGQRTLFDRLERIDERLAKIENRLAQDD